MLSRLSICVSFASLALAGILSGAACSSSTGTAGTTGGGGQSTGTGGPVEGPADTHCGTKKQAVSAASCHPAMTTSSSTGAGGAGTTGAGGAAISEYGATLDNAEGDDDDCKYHLAWTATPISQSTDVTFTAVVTTTTDSKPLAAGELDLEVFLNDTHPAPNSDAKVTESPTGTYKIGPIRFDAAGKWTVRFHVHEDCSDLSADSPHGHVAFFVNVP